MSSGTEQLTEQNRYPLERPWIRWQLVRELALKEETRAQLARRYGVDRSAMTQFAQRHTAAIAAVEREIENEMAGLWIAQKRNRIAVYQQDVEEITKLVERDVDPSTAPNRPADRDDPGAGQIVVLGAKVPSLLRVKAQILHQVAEELGELSVKISVEAQELGNQIASLVEELSRNDDDGAADQL